MFKKIKNERLYLKISKQIRNNIVIGKLKAGDKLLPERVLAEEFGVSRATIREAMSALEILGIIENKGSRGNFVRVDGTDTSLDSELFKELLKSHSPYEVFEARCEIEPIVASLAAKRRNEENIKKLNNHLKKLNSLGWQLKKSPEKKGDYMEEDRKFHLEIAHITNNEVLFTVYSGLNLMLKEKHWKIMKLKSLQNEENIKKFENEHTKIFDAIRNGYSEDASNYAREHLEFIKKDMFDD